eukprot:6178709-Pleurochrysis_carterae.AAC.6
MLSSAPVPPVHEVPRIAIGMVGISAASIHWLCLSYWNDAAHFSFSLRQWIESSFAVLEAVTSR